jgi:hypothetical protein
MSTAASIRYPDGNEINRLSFLPVHFVEMDDLLKDISIHQFQLISQFVCFGESLSNAVRKSPGSFH